MCATSEHGEFQLRNEESESFEYEMERGGVSASSKETASEALSTHANETPSAAVVPAVSSTPRVCSGISSPSSLCVDEGATIVQDDLDLLLEMLPVRLRQQLREHPQRASLLEVVLDLGRKPEARFLNAASTSSTAVTDEGDANEKNDAMSGNGGGGDGGDSLPRKTSIYLRDSPVTKEELEAAERSVGAFGGDNRAGVPQTLHRISAIRNRKGDVVGLTCRVGRAVTGHIDMIRDILDDEESILFLGPPGVGKTTVIREMARVIADEMYKRVVIVDTSNEIGGDGDVPHPAIGGARRMQVAEPSMQHRVMIEAVQNHMPEIIVVDEVGTETECVACRSIAERGVMLVATAHGHTLQNLLKNPSINDLIGGIESVTLGDDEARARGSRKTVLERKGPPTFPIVIEMRSRSVWVIHKTDNSVDSLLLDKVPTVMVRSRGGEEDNFEVETRLVPYEDEIEKMGVSQFTSAFGDATGSLGMDGRRGMAGGSNGAAMSGKGHHQRSYDMRVSPMQMIVNPALAAAQNAGVNRRASAASSKSNGNGSVSSSNTSGENGNGAAAGNGKTRTAAKKTTADPYAWVDSLESLQTWSSNGNGRSAEPGYSGGYELIALDDDDETDDDEEDHDDDDKFSLSSDSDRNDMFLGYDQMDRRDKKRKDKAKAKAKKKGKGQ